MVASGALHGRKWRIAWLEVAHCMIRSGAVHGCKWRIAWLEVAHCMVRSDALHVRSGALHG